MPQHPTSWRSIFNIILAYKAGSTNWFPSIKFFTKTLYTPLLSPIRATCPTHLILLDLVTQIIFHKKHRSWSSSLCSLLHYPVTSFLDQNITLLSPIRATCPTHLILLDFVTQIIFHEEHRSWSSSLCSLLHYPVTSFLGQNITLLSPIRATCPTHLILLDFVTQILFHEEHRSWSSSLCSLLHYLVTSFLCQNITLLCPIRATCPTHLILLDFVTQIIYHEEHRSWSSSLCSLLHYPVTSSLGPNIFLSTLFSNTLSLVSSHNMRGQVSHPYTTTGKIAFLNMKYLIKIETHTHVYCTCILP